jgi:hypothetical protein
MLDDLRNALRRWTRSALRSPPSCSRQSRSSRAICQRAAHSVSIPSSRSVKNDRLGAQHRQPTDLNVVYTTSNGGIERRKSQLAWRAAVYTLGHDRMGQVDR